MALGVTSKLGTVAALGGGAVGIGIVVFALMGGPEDAPQTQADDTRASVDQSDGSPSVGQEDAAAAPQASAEVENGNGSEATVPSSGDDAPTVVVESQPEVETAIDEVVEVAPQSPEPDTVETAPMQAEVEPVEPITDAPVIADVTPSAPEPEEQAAPQVIAEEAAPAEPEASEDVVDLPQVAAPETDEDQVNLPQLDAPDAGEEMAALPPEDAPDAAEEQASLPQENAPDTGEEMAALPSESTDAPAGEQANLPQAAPSAQTEETQAPVPDVDTVVAALPTPRVAEPAPVAVPEDVAQAEPAATNPSGLDLGDEIVLAPQAETQSPGAPALDPTDPAVPKFDLVRIEQDGSGLIAGRAAPNAYVRIVSDGQEIAETKAGANGEFVAFVDIAVGQPAQLVELTSSVDGGPRVRSVDNVIVLNQAGQGTAEKIAAIAAATEEVETQEAAQIADVPQAPAILRSGREGLQVMQPAGLAQVDQITLDSISYDDAGAVVLAGRGRPGNTARIYVNANKVADSEISTGGTWRAELSGVAAGRYVLRVDELTAEGTVASRAESPFQREYPTAEKLALLTEADQIIVQPGNSLWKIAESRYGEGIKYWLIYGANKSQIRDPNLIYPGQIFAMPDNN